MEQFRGLLQQVTAEHGLRAGRQSLEHGLGDAVDGIDGVRIAFLLGQRANLKGGERHGRVQHLAERIRSPVAEQRIRVVPRRERRHAHGETGFEKEGAGAQRGLASGGVAVENQQYAVGVLAEQFDVLLGEGRPLRGHGRIEAGGMTADHIDLPLADEGFAARVLDNGAAGLVERIQDAAFDEDGRFRAVDVLGGMALGIEHAAAERHHAPLRVADGEHEAAMEPVIVVIRPVGVVGRGEQARGHERLRLEAVLFAPAQQGVGRLRRVADAETLGDFVGQFAAGEIVARHGGLRRLQQAAAVEGGGFGVDGQQDIAFFGGVVGLDGERHAGALGQEAHGVHEAEAILRHQEFEHVAMRAAAETVVGLAGGVDLKGGGFLLVERAAGLEGAAHAPERHAGVDEPDNVRAGADFLQHAVCHSLAHTEVISIVADGRSLAADERSRRRGRPFVCAPQDAVSFPRSSPAGARPGE